MYFNFVGWVGGRGGHVGGRGGVGRVGGVKMYDCVVTHCFMLLGTLSSQPGAILHFSWVYSIV